MFGEFDNDRFISPSIDLPTPPPPPPPLPNPSITQHMSATKNHPLATPAHDDTSHSQLSSSHKSITNFTTTIKEHIPLLRETDSVNPQYHLNINDVLSCYPVLLNKTSHLNQTKD